jgi:hypothetical protein
MKKNTGSRWEITVDAVSRTYRHDRTIAIESAKYLKLKQPMTDVVRDLEGLEETVVISAHFRVHKAPSSRTTSRAAAIFQIFIKLSIWKPWRA